jgi:hypothetical protein
VDATPEVQAALKEELDKLDRQFNAVGKDMTQFPTFNFQGTQTLKGGKKLGSSKSIMLILTL